jgi:hypothetical protein
MNTCPGCGGGIPNNETPGLYPGLIVRPGEIVWPGSEGQ